MCRTFIGIAARSPAEKTRLVFAHFIEYRHDVVCGNGQRRPGQTESAAGSAITRDDAGPAELTEDLTQVVSGYAALLGDLLYLQPRIWWKCGQGGEGSQRVFGSPGKHR